MMQIKQYSWDVVNANSWLITDDNDGILIDAVDNPNLFKAIVELSTLTIILTHCHFDHIIGLNKIREIRPDASVVSTGLCSEYIGNKFRNMSSSASAFMTFYEEGRKKGIKIAPFTCAPADETFDEEKKLSWKGHEIQLTAFQGHSKDGLIAVIDDQYMFSGDTLLSIPTVTRLPGGNTRLFWDKDIPKLRTMPTERVFPGHGREGEKDEMLSINQNC